MIDRWARLWSGTEAPVAMAAVRILLALVVLGDLATMAQVGAVDLLWGADTAGGIGTGTGPAWFWWDSVHTVLPSGWWLWGGLVGAATLLLLGVGARPAAVVFALLSTQAALMLPASDRGIDMLVRNVCWLLAVSRCDDAWSVRAWWRTGFVRGDGVEVPAWPRRLLWLQLLAVYFLAGLQKFGASWTPVGDFLALWFILQDWAVTRGPADWLFTGPGLLATQVASAVTVAWEWSAPLLLGTAWARRRAGRLGDWVRRWRPDDVWVAVGIVFHVGIAVTMDLGMFPWAMLALYPAFVRVER